VQVVIIGGSDAGISAALRMRELDTTIRPTVILADHYPNYSICGLPFLHSGEVSDWHNLAHRTAEEIEQQGIILQLDSQAEAIDPARQTVVVATPDGRQEFSYDRLIIATGATSVHPAIKGLDLPGVHLLRWMGDSFAIEQTLAERKPRRAIIIGGGYIGLEMADALTLRGLEVTVIEHSPTVLKTLDPGLSQLVRAELERHGVRVVPKVRVEQIEEVEGELKVSGTPGFTASADLVLVAVGVKPQSVLAQQAGIAVNEQGAIVVNRRMETSLPDIYAAGDCVETWHRLLEQHIYLPLGTTAHKQGRVAGENVLGAQREYAGSLGTQVVKVFELVAARTGLRDDEAGAAGFIPLTVESEVYDHKVYYPGARYIRIRITGDQESRRLLGAQLVGSYGSEISKRVDIFATALHHGMSVEGLNELDLSYTPPLGSPWDAVQMAAQTWLRQARSI
jgi:NADPH-dependent 2,4-dienoyl-CoA reductase/sulfur reductase-like enzyme